MISVEMSGVTEVRLKLDQLGKYFKNLRPLLLGVITLVDQYVKLQFISGGQGSGGWMPLLPATVKRKLKLGGTSQILIGAGPYAGQLKSNWETIVGEREATYKSAAFYAPFHEYGTKNLPVRRMTPQTVQLDAMAERAAADFVQRGIQS